VYSFVSAKNRKHLTINQRVQIFTDCPRLYRWSEAPGKPSKMSTVTVQFMYK